jgi:hypothetical protein
MTMIDNFYGALMYTVLCFIISFLYYNKGKKDGIRDTISVLAEYDMLALEKMRHILKEKLHV